MKEIFRGHCQRCGAEYTTDSRHAGKKRYCSKSCVTLAKRERERMPIQTEDRFDHRALMAVF